MNHQDVYNALDTLLEYPAITEYIKSFDGNGGFMYTTETDPDRIEIKKQMEDILDDGHHSGASWGYMMRIVQCVLNGVITVEKLQEEDRIRQAEYQAWLLARRVQIAAAALEKEENTTAAAALVNEETEAETAALIKEQTEEETAVVEKKKRYTQV